VPSNKPAMIRRWCVCFVAMLLLGQLTGAAAQVQLDGVFPASGDGHVRRGCYGGVPDVVLWCFRCLSRTLPTSWPSGRASPLRRCRLMRRERLIKMEEVLHGRVIGQVGAAAGWLDGCWQCSWAAAAVQLQLVASLCCILLITDGGWMNCRAAGARRDSAARRPAMSSLWSHCRGCLDAVLGGSRWVTVWQRCTDVLFVMSAA